MEKCSKGGSEESEFRPRMSAVLETQKMADVKQMSRGQPTVSESVSDTLCFLIIETQAPAMQTFLTMGKKQQYPPSDFTLASETKGKKREDHRQRISAVAETIKREGHTMLLPL